MKTLILFIAIILIAAIGIASFAFFLWGAYYLSALLTISVLFALSGWVYYMVPKQTPALQ